MKKFICIKDFIMGDLFLKVGDGCLIEVDDIGFTLRADVNGKSLIITMPARYGVPDIKSIQKNLRNN